MEMKIICNIFIMSKIKLIIVFSFIFGNLFSINNKTLIDSLKNELHKNNNNIKIAEISSNIGSLYFQSGNYSQAIIYKQQAAPVFRTFSGHPHKSL